MVIHSKKSRTSSNPVVKQEEKKVFEEVKVEKAEKSVKKSKKIKEEEPILPLIEDDFSLIEEEYNS